MPFASNLDGVAIYNRYFSGDFPCPQNPSKYRFDWTYGDNSGSEDVRTRLYYPYDTCVSYVRNTVDPAKYQSRVFRVDEPTISLTQRRYLAKDGVSELSTCIDEDSSAYVGSGPSPSDAMDYGCEAVTQSGSLNSQKHRWEIYDDANQRDWAARVDISLRGSESVACSDAAAGTVGSSILVESHAISMKVGECIKLNSNELISESYDIYAKVFNTSEVALGLYTDDQCADPETGGWYMSEAEGAGKCGQINSYDVTAYLTQGYVAQLPGRPGTTSSESSSESESQSSSSSSSDSCDCSCESADPLGTSAGEIGSASATTSSFMFACSAIIVCLLGSM
jgi:hypothetical protein